MVSLVIINSPITVGRKSVEKYRKKISVKQ